MYRSLEYKKMCNSAVNTKPWSEGIDNLEAGQAR